MTPEAKHVSTPVVVSLSLDRLEEIKGEMNGRQFTVVDIDAIPVPATGGGFIDTIKKMGPGVGCLVGCTGFLVLGTLATAEIWGTGAGLLVEGGYRNDTTGADLQLAGRIILVYVTPPLLGFLACIGGIYGACMGGILKKS
jgi:hypothetical protein